MTSRLILEDNQDLCGTCMGDGYIYVECPYCHGSGWVDRRPGWELCCSGQNMETCPDCMGSGIEEG